MVRLDKACKRVQGSSGQGTDRSSALTFGDWSSLFAAPTLALRLPDAHPSSAPSQF